MTKLATAMVYDCCIMLLLFSTKSRPLCRNYNSELLMQKHDRAYSADKFRRKYVGDIKMLYSITRECHIHNMLYDSKYVQNVS